MSWPSRRLRGYVEDMTYPPIPRQPEDRWEYLNEKTGSWQTLAEMRDTAALLDARRVWAVLVNYADANDADSDWASFRQWFDRAVSRGGDEYRFMGSLGFGGKFWINRHNEMHVSCYREDLTPDREATIAETNIALTRLLGERHG